jgi:hypothetical protein
MYCNVSFLSSAVGDGLLFLIYFSPNPLSFKAPTITVQVHASLSKKIRFFSSTDLGRAGFLANLLVAEGSFLFTSSGQ